jgi:hypothetical protein
MSDPRKLIEMLRYRRPHESSSERIFIEKFIDCFPNVEKDAFENRIVRVGDPGGILYSCHTDTVHSLHGMQTVYMDGKFAKVKSKKSNCLGADNAVGIYVLSEMILAGVPGLYIFHRGEECGGLGSTFIADKTPTLLDGISIALAVDRRGTTDIINYQSGKKCASDEFCESLSKQLGMGYKANTGLFTDTANYMDIIPECSNLSSGYFDEHRRQERVDIDHVEALLAQLKKLDVSKLAVERDPKVTEYRHAQWNHDTKSHFGKSNFGSSRDVGFSKDTIATHGGVACTLGMQQLVYKHPVQCAMILAELGYDYFSLYDEIGEQSLAALANDRDDYSELWFLD